MKSTRPVAVITGAARGIGKGCALELARGGFNLLINDLPDADSVEKLGNDSNLLIVFYVQIMPDDFVMQLHRF